MNNYGILVPAGWTGLPKFILMLALNALLTPCQFNHKEAVCFVERP